MAHLGLADDYHFPPVLRHLNRLSLDQGGIWENAVLAKLFAVC